MVKVELLGLIIGRYVYVRAASSELRVATAMADEGVYDVVAATLNSIDDDLRSEIRDKGFESVKVLVRGCCESKECYKIEAGH